MSKFKKEHAYEEAGETAQVGSRDGKRVIRVDREEVPIDRHVQSRQIVNPLNPYEVYGSEEELARSVARTVAEVKKAKGDE